MVRFALRPLPTSLMGDAELVQTHRRVSIVARVAIACAVTLVPFVALGSWVLFAK